MITADTKDWTWVLEAPCGECGFDASTCPAHEVAGLVRVNAGRWGDLLGAGAIRPGRADERTWSPLEYAAHVRDVFRRYDQRITLMLGEDDPLFANWDQDATAVEDRYDGQDPATVVQQLQAAAGLMASRLDELAGADWNRPGRRSDGAAFTVGSLVRYMIHDPVHHLWDVTHRRP